MAKLTAVPGKPAPAPKAAPIKAAPRDATDDLVMLSHEDELALMLLMIHGSVGSGKTFLAASASEFFPAKLPAPKLTVLEDMFWIAADIGAVDGFKHNRISVPHVKLVDLCAKEELWRKAGFQRAPSIVEAAAWGIQKATEWVARGKTKYVVFDTISTFDTRLGVYADLATAGSPNQYAPYKFSLAAHEKVHDSLTRCGANVIYLCHSRSVNQDNANEKKKNDTVLVAGGASFVPELTGAAPKIYKRDASLEIFMRAYKAPGKKQIVREAVTTVNDWGAECKNRFEGLLDPIEEPHLGHMLEKIRRAQK